MRLECEVEEDELRVPPLRYASVGIKVVFESAWTAGSSALLGITVGVELGS